MKAHSKTKEGTHRKMEEKNATKPKEEKKNAFMCMKMLQKQCREYHNTEMNESSRNKGRDM